MPPFLNALNRACKVFSNNIKKATEIIIFNRAMHKWNQILLTTVIEASFLCSSVHVKAAERNNHRASCPSKTGAANLIVVCCAVLFKKGTVSLL